MSKSTVKLNSDELKVFLKHIINNNRLLQKEGKIPVAVNVVGESGIGKTSTILQVAQEENLKLIKLNLAQIEELGDLTGFPVKEFQVCKENSDQCEWVVEHAIQERVKEGYTFTGVSRMGYCPPEWIADITSGGILLLDDWNRADPRFLQAVMELIDRQQYISWTMPKDWHIVLSMNPDNGEYLVNAMDKAQSTRFISVDAKFDVKCWAQWAESANIDGRCINYLMMNPESVAGDSQVNARSAVMFFNSISSLKPFEEHLPLIQMIGEGSVGDAFASLFTTFINNKLDKLPSPQEILFGENETIVVNRLKEVIKSGDKYRADIASTLALRVINLASLHAKENKVEKSLIERIAKLVTEEIFTVDLRYQIVKKIFASNTEKFASLALQKGVTPMIMGDKKK